MELQMSFRWSDTNSTAPVVLIVLSLFGKHLSRPNQMEVVVIPVSGFEGGSR